VGTERGISVRCWEVSARLLGQWRLSDRCGVSAGSLLEHRTLRGHCAKAQGDAPPLAVVGTRLRQMHDEAMHRALDAGAELEQPFAQGRDPSTRQAGAAGAAAQLLHQHVGRGGERDTQLIGEEARAAGAIAERLRVLVPPIRGVPSLSSSASGQNRLCWTGMEGEHHMPTARCVREPTGRVTRLSAGKQLSRHFLILTVLATVLAACGGGRAGGGSAAAGFVSINCSGDRSGAKDTAAIQAAIDNLGYNSAVGNSIQLANCEFYIDATLTIKEKAGFRIYGTSRGGTIINMVRNNTPIFTFTASSKQNTNAWDMGYFTLQWSDNQSFNVTASVSTAGVMTVTTTAGTLAAGQTVGGPGMPTEPTITSQLSGKAGSTGTYQLSAAPLSAISPETIAVANSSALGFYFTGGTSVYHFDWNVTRVTFNNGFRAFSTDATNPALVWGATVDNFTVQPTASGAFFWANNAGAGQPRIAFRDGHIVCPAIAIDPEIAINAVDGILLENVEMNNGSFTSSVPQVYINSGLNVTFVNVKSESASITGGTGGNVPALWNLANTNAVLIGVKVANLTVTGSSSQAVFVSDNLTTFGQLSIHGMSVFAIGSGNNLLAYSAGAILEVENLSLFGIATIGNRAYLGNVQAAKLLADALTMNATQKQGDNSYSAAITDARVVWYDAALTANRTVTLPKCTFDGQEFDVVRKTATPGAFTLTVADPVSGFSEVIPASTNGFSNWRCVGTEWIPIAQGTL